MKAILKTTAIFMLIMVLSLGCAANKPKTEPGKESEAKSDDIDNLFGISESEKSGSTQSDDEAEVLRLLGITKDESEAPQVPEQTVADKENENDLRREVTDLEQQLLNKEAEIASLKSDIATKDQKIGSMETNVTSRSDAQPRSVTSGDFLQDYQNAYAEYQNRNYKQAIAAFEDLLARDENNSYLDNCQYWIGECYYGLSNFNQAIVEFTKVFSFTNSNKNDDAQLKLGLCYWKLGDKQKAREEFERLLSEYPKSEYLEKAEFFLSRL